MKTKYRIMSWLFFGGNDIVFKDNLTKEEAEDQCKLLNETNQDSTYSGFYTQEYS